MNYGVIVQRAREAEGLNITELAQAIDIDRSVLSRIEDGKVRIEPRVFNALCEALPTLSRVDLLNAMGYVVRVPKGDRVPEKLADAWADFTPQQRAWLMRGVNALMLEPRGPYGSEAPQ